MTETSPIILASDILLPGDLILLSHKTPNAASRSIIDTQKIVGFTEQHAKWHHAVIYAGEKKLIESAIFNKVRFLPEASYFKYLGGKFHYKIMRLKDANDEQRTEVAKTAATFIGKKYNYWTILSYRLILHFGITYAGPKTKRLNCGHLFAAACSDNGHQLFPELSMSLVTPAHLSQCDKLISVKHEAVSTINLGV